MPLWASQFSCWWPPPRVDLHEPHAALDQPPGDQALPAERATGRSASVWSVGLGSLTPYISSVSASSCDRSSTSGARDLQLERQLVAGDAGRQLGVAGARGQVLGVERVERVDLVALHLAGRGRRRRTRSRIGSPWMRKMRALVGGRHEAARPVRRPADRPAAGVEHHHVAGQVLVLAAQAVAQPGADATGWPWMMRPLFIWIIAEPWANVSAYRLLMIASLSMCWAMCGKRRSTTGPTGRTA